MCDGLHNCATEGTLTIRSQTAGGAGGGGRRLAGTDAAEERLLRGWHSDVCLALGRYPDHCEGVTVEVVSDDGAFTVVRTPVCPCKLAIGPFSRTLTARWARARARGGGVHCMVDQC